MEMQISTMLHAMLGGVRVFESECKLDYYWRWRLIVTKAYRQIIQEDSYESSCIIWQTDIWETGINNLITKTTIVDITQWMGTSKKSITTYPLFENSDSQLESSAGHL